MPSVETQTRELFGIGDPDSFAGLVKQHQSMVFSIAYAALRDRSVAEEVAQDVFLELHRILPALESPSHVVNWLRRAAAHRSIDRHRRQRTWLRFLWPLEQAPEPAAPAAGGDILLTASLRQWIASLPAKPRLVMILRYQEDMEATEIAELLKMPLGTVKSHVQRSLKLLRDKLARHGGISL
ncbi:MAG TPA: sigma-70 family RNA polymerase sigma factor [Bryobacteraceae bacterium]|jgi:RNA polymerase sigma-70 factor (ECF subfamily)